MSELDVYNLLDSMQMTYEVIEHGHIATIDEWKETNINGLEYVVKNLFVRDDKKGTIILLLLNKIKIFIWKIYKNSCNLVD